jgi:ATP-dependent RNA helicase RhlE
MTKSSQAGDALDAPPETFENLSLSRGLLKTIRGLGWQQPTPIQSQAVPLIMGGHDLIGVAQTGTGKTGAFLLPIIEQLGVPSPHIRALVLEPTRELALQVDKALGEILGDSPLTHAIVYGGAPIGPQRLALKRGVDILVATPGRLLDLMGQMMIYWRDMRFLVLDEADRMLDMGFMPDIERILRRLPMARQTLLFTATMPPEIARIGRDHMLEPEEVTIGFNRSIAEGITEWLYPVRTDQKTALLLSLIDELHIESGIIFCAMKSGADRVGEALRRRGHTVGILHSDRSQDDREKTLQQFRDGEIPLLVATDVASRGLDITGITHIINHDVPQSPDDYIHRAGRTARVDAKGDAITLVSPEEERSLAAVERLLERRFERSVLADFPYRGDPLGRPARSAPRKPSRARRGGGKQRGRHSGPGHSRNR